MNTPAVTPFSFRSHPVRVVVRDGDPWFVAVDVAIALGYRSPKDAASVLADHQKGSGSIRTLGGDQTVTIINESGLYRLVLRSRKPEAVAFSDWVTGEVLPSIRKTGGYQATPLCSMPLPVGKAWLVRLSDDGQLHWQPTSPSARLLNPNNKISLDMFMTLASTDVIESAMQAGAKELASRARGQLGGDVLMDRMVDALSKESA